MRYLSQSVIVLSLFVLIPAASAGKTRTVKNNPLQTAGTLETTTATQSFSKGLKGQLERVVASHHGVMGLGLKNLETGEKVSINGDELFPTASTIKLAIMCAAFDELSSPSGKIKDYYETRVYDEATSTGGAGFIQRFKDGTKIEMKELIHMMITVSDNVATNMMIDWIGFDSVNGWLDRHGFKQTRLNSMIGGRKVWNQEMREKWGLGVTTPNEMCQLLEMLRTGKAGTTSTTDEMLRVLSHQYFDDGIAGSVPPGVWVASKSGAVNQSRSDNAIVSSPGGTYVLSIYTKENEDTSWKNTNEAEQKIREISRLVWKHYNPNSRWTRPAGTEKF